MSEFRPGDERTTVKPGDVARTETRALISSERVAGTEVHDAAGKQLGTIRSLMIGKSDGHVAYAVLSFGGWFGVGSQFFPVPWSQLTYSPERGAYVIGLTEQQLKAAPQFAHEDDAAWDDVDWRNRLDGYYGAGGPGTSGIG